MGFLFWGVAVLGVSLFFVKNCKHQLQSTPITV